MVKLQKEAHIKTFKFKWFFFKYTLNKIKQDLSNQYCLIISYYNICNVH